MKAILAILLLCLAFSTHAQLPVDPNTGKVVYSGSVPLPNGVTSTQAFGRAKVWLSDAFTGHATLAEDAASGLLSGGGVERVKDFTYSFRVRLQVEANQVKYKLDDFTYTYLDPMSHTTKGGTAEEQRDSKLFMGKGTRAKMLAELDEKVRAGLGQLSGELAGTL